MVSPPAPTARRALIAAGCLAVVLAGLIAAVWGVAWALEGSAPPSAASVAAATHLAFPEGTEVVEADLTQMQTAAPGDRAEVTVDVPAAVFDEFLDANAMDPPLLAGTTPAGTASGVIPAGCGPDSCWAANIVIAEDAVTVYLVVTLI